MIKLILLALIWIVYSIFCVKYDKKVVNDKKFKHYKSKLKF